MAEFTFFEEYYYFDTQHTQKVEELKKWEVKYKELVGMMSERTSNDIVRSYLNAIKNIELCQVEISKASEEQIRASNKIYAFFEGHPDVKKVEIRLANNTRVSIGKNVHNNELEILSVL